MNGEAHEALATLAERGLLNIVDTKAEAMAALIEKWKTDDAPLTESLILAATRKDVTTLNQMAQYERLTSRQLGERSIQAGDYQFYEGDRVMFTQPSTVRGIANGDRGVILSVNTRDRTITARIDQGARVTVGLDDFPHVALGYASTTHKGQGATSDATYVLAGGSMQDRELSYVQASRARHLTHFFATRVEVGDEIEYLSREMSRSRQKEMAHTLIREHSLEPELQ